jgi:hypothetical protein
VGPQKRPQIALSDPDDAAHSVHDKAAALDPAADCARGDLNPFGHLRDREEPNSIAGLTTTLGNIGDAHDAASSRPNAFSEA